MPETIVFGFDFGTTFSGAAYAFSSKPSNIEQITSWNASRSIASDVDKAPTKLLADDIHNETEWGYGISSEEKAFKWFKLLLLNEEDIPKDLQASKQLSEAQGIQQRIGQDPVFIIASYLRHLWTHAIQCVKRQKGELLVDSCKFRIILTVPAIWPHYAVNRMRKAAEIADMLDVRSSGETTLEFISEPEAAALATLSDMKERCDIKVGDSIVICDAGGGTVFDEHVQGEGGLCGAVFLDETFEDFIKDKVGASAWDKAKVAQKYKTLNIEWEHCIKRQFGGSRHNRPWLVTLPENCTVVRDNDSRNRTRDLQITSAQIMDVFKPITDQVVDLVARQVKEIYRKSATDPKFIVLVGGFGRSPLLYTELKKANPFSIVLQSQGSSPWTAICRGAVMRGLATDPSCKMYKVPAAIGARIARISYGTLSNQLWDKSKHKGVPKTDKFRQGKKATFSYESNFEMDQEITEPIEEELYFSSADNIPTQNCEEIEVLCSVKWNKAISSRSLPMRRSPEGQAFRVLLYKIEVTFGAAALDIAVIYDDERAGDKSVSVDFDEKNYRIESGDEI